jgi:hypothetical protein
MARLTASPFEAPAPPPPRCVSALRRVPAPPVYAPGRVYAPARVYAPGRVYAPAPRNAPPCLCPGTPASSPSLDLIYHHILGRPKYRS